MINEKLRFTGKPVKCTREIFSCQVIGQFSFTTFPNTPGKKIITYVLKKNKADFYQKLLQMFQ